MAARSKGTHRGVTLRMLCRWLCRRSDNQDPEYYVRNYGYPPPVPVDAGRAIRTVMPCTSRENATTA